MPHAIHSSGTTSTGARSRQMLRSAGVLVTLMLVGCGSPTLPPAQAPALPSETTTADDVDTPDAAVVASTALDVTDEVGNEEDAAPNLGDTVTTSGEWRDVTANLVGLESDCGNLSFVASHPENSLVMAGVALHGLWKLSDDGTAWTQLGVGPSSASITNRTSSITFDPDAPDTFWQSGTYDAGTYKTDDAGATFEQLGDVQHIDFVSVDLGDPQRQTMLAGGHERTDVYRSVDGGQNWTSLGLQLPASSGNASFPLVVDAMTYLLGTNGGTESGIFRSDDGGATWTMVFAEPVASAPVVVDGTIYWLVSNGGGLVVSRDDGSTFEYAGSATAGSPSSLLPLPGGVLATHNDRRLLLTDDEGATWHGVDAELPFIPRGISYSASREAFYIWQFSCSFGPEGNDIMSMSIMQLDVSIGE